MDRFAAIPGDSWPADTAVPALWGTAMHSAVSREACAADPWLTWADAVRDVLWDPRLGEHEVTCAYSCATGDVTLFRSDSEAERTAWKMARPDDEVVGTCDWWAALPDGTPWVDDLKTGWRIPGVDTNANRFYLLCRALAAGGELGGFASILWWPRKPDMAESEPRRLWSRKIRADQLLKFQNDLVAAWERVQGHRYPVAGPHCGYCPSVRVCPAHNDPSGSIPDSEESE